MESKGSTRSGNKPDTKITSSGKPEKPNPGPTTTTDKKETPPKEQPAPGTTTPAKKVAAATANEAAGVNSHSSVKPGSTAAAVEVPESVSHPADSDHKGNNAEESPGSSSIFENMKPLIIVGGAAAAVIAVIVGVALLARKK